MGLWTSKGVNITEKKKTHQVPPDVQQAICEILPKTSNLSLIKPLDLGTD